MATLKEEVMEEAEKGLTVDKEKLKYCFLLMRQILEHAKLRIKLDKETFERCSEGKTRSVGWYRSMMLIDEVIKELE